MNLWWHDWSIRLGHWSFLLIGTWTSKMNFWSKIPQRRPKCFNSWRLGQINIFVWCERRKRSLCSHIWSRTMFKLNRFLFKLYSDRFLLTIRFSLNLGHVNLFKRSNSWIWLQHNLQWKRLFKFCQLHQRWKNNFHWWKKLRS